MSISTTWGGDRWYGLVVLVVIGYGLQLLSPVLTPFLMGMLLAYLGDPVVDRLESRGWIRSIAVVVVMLAILLFGLILIVVLIPQIQQQISALMGRMPGYLLWLEQEGVAMMAAWLGLDIEAVTLQSLMPWIGQHVQEHGDGLSSLIALLSNSGMTVLGWIVNLLLVPVVTFYMLRDWDLFIDHCRDLVPRRYLAVISQLAGDSDMVLGAFMRGQMTVMLALGTIYTLGLWWVGVEFALLIGVVAGVVSFVPYLGLIVGLLTAGMAAVLQFHSLEPLIGVGGVFLVAQLLEATILTPLLLGDRIGLHPVVVIFAVMAGGELFGFIGVLLALPVAAIVMVGLRYSHSRYIESEIYGRE